MHLVVGGGLGVLFWVLLFVFVFVVLGLGWMIWNLGLGLLGKWVLYV